MKEITDEQIIEAAKESAAVFGVEFDYFTKGAKWMQEHMQSDWINVSDELPPFDTPVMLRGVISWKSRNSVSYFSDEVQVDSEMLEYGQSAYTLKFNNDYLVCSHPNPEELMDEYITHWKLLVEPPTA